jgi:hypothetical protein
VLVNSERAILAASDKPFVTGNVNLTNRSAGTFTPVDGDTFTLEVTPTSPGTVTVSVAAGVTQDTAGNDNTSDSASVTSSAADGLAGGQGNDTLNGVFRNDAFSEVIGRDTLIGGQRPAGRPAPIPATPEPANAPSEPLFMTRQVDNDDIDELFTGSLLPELLEL